MSTPPLLFAVSNHPRALCSDDLDGDGLIINLPASGFLRVTGLHPNANGYQVHEIDGTRTDLAHRIWDPQDPEFVIRHGTLVASFIDLEPRHVFEHNNHPREVWL